MSLPLFLLPLGVIGPTQLILIVLVIIIFFGAKKIPDLMKGMGRGVKEFKDAVNKDYTAEENTKSVAGKSEDTKKIEE